MRRIGACAFALAALVVGACGGGSDKKDSATNANSNAAGALSKLAAGDLANVCGSKAAVNVGAAFASALSGSNGTVDYKAEADALQKAADAAPSEIKSDFQLLATKLKPFLIAIGDAHGDYQKLAQSDAFKNASTELGSDEYKAAADHISTWFADHCK